VIVFRRSCLIYANNISGTGTESDILRYIEYLIELDINSVSAVNERKIAYLGEL